MPPALAIRLLAAAAGIGLTVWMIESTNGTARDGTTARAMGLYFAGVMCPRSLGDRALAVHLEPRSSGVSQCARLCYGYVMTIRRITLSVPKEVARRIKRAAGQKPTSQWVTELIEEHLDESELERQWKRFCREVAPKPSEIRKADALFKRLTRSRERGAA